MLSVRRDAELNLEAGSSICPVLTDVVLTTENESTSPEIPLTTSDVNEVLTTSEAKNMYSNAVTSAKYITSDSVSHVQETIATEAATTTTQNPHTFTELVTTLTPSENISSRSTEESLVITKVSSVTSNDSNEPTIAFTDNKEPTIAFADTTMKPLFDDGKSGNVLIVICGKF